MGEIKRHHRGVCNGEPGRRTLNEAIRKDTKPEDLNKVWTKRRVLFATKDLYIEAVDTPEDATSLGQRGGGCVGTLYRTQKNDKPQYKILKVVTKDGETKGLMTLGRADIYELYWAKQKENKGNYSYDVGYPTYANCNDLKLERGPATALKIDNERWHVLEALEVYLDKRWGYEKGGYLYHKPVTGDLLAMYKEFHARYQVKEA